VKKNAHIVTVVAAGSVALALGVLAPAGRAPAADRRPADATQPNYQYTPERGERPSRGTVHVDRHADYRVGGTERSGPAADDDKRDGRPDARPDSRWTPGAERYTRPAHQWNR